MVVLNTFAFPNLIKYLDCQMGFLFYLYFFQLRGYIFQLFYCFYVLVILEYILNQCRLPINEWHKYIVTSAMLQVYLFSSVIIFKPLKKAFGNLSFYWVECFSNYF